jgi:hypothetical protein
LTTGRDQPGQLAEGDPDLGPLGDYLAERLAGTIAAGLA